MKFLITKEQYEILVFKLLETLFGELKIVTVKEKQKKGRDDDYHDIYDKDGEEVANIWVKGDNKNKGCKRDLTFLDDSTKKKWKVLFPIINIKCSLKF